MRFSGLAWLALPLAPLSLMAQPQAPIGLVRGRLTECHSSVGAGELTIRTADGQVFRFAFDDKTYFEREQQLTRPGKLEEGDWLEIVADKTPESVLRYARTVHVIEPKTATRLRPAAGATVNRGPLDPFFARGDLSFSGVVARVNNASLVLHTRAGEKIILLRQDTSFIAQGKPVEGSALEPNTRVFVRAAKNLDNQIEAYQIVWGEILEPR